MQREVMQDDLEDLTWYFGGGAEADCGVRSVQGGFEAQMNRMALAGKPEEAHEVWADGKPTWVEAQLPAKESRATAARFDLPIGEEEAMAERILAQVEDRLGHRDSLARMARVYARLRQLDHHHHAVLELQYGDAIKVGGVSLSLLCMSKPVSIAVHRINERRRRRAEKDGENPPDPLGQREAVARLHLSGIDADKEILEALVGEATTRLRVAVEAYSKARS